MKQPPRVCQECKKLKVAFVHMDGTFDYTCGCPQCEYREVYKQAEQEERRAVIIVNGNCVICGKPLSGNRLFLCEECEEKEKDTKICWNCVYRKQSKLKIQFNEVPLSSYCDNKNSPAFNKYVWGNDSCPEWEGEKNGE